MGCQLVSPGVFHVGLHVATCNSTGHYGWFQRSTVRAECSLVYFLMSSFRSLAASFLLYSVSQNKSQRQLRMKRKENRYHNSVGRVPKNLWPSLFYQHPPLVAHYLHFTHKEKHSFIFKILQNINSLRQQNEAWDSRSYHLNHVQVQMRPIVCFHGSSNLWI